MSLIAAVRRPSGQQADSDTRHAKGGTAAGRHVRAAGSLAIHMTCDGDREWKSIVARTMLLLSARRTGLERAGEVTVGRYGT